MTSPDAGSQPSRSARGAHVLIALALACATLAIYAQVRHHEFLTYDDPEYVLQNPNLRGGLSWDGVLRMFREPRPVWDRVPLTALSLQVDYELHGLDPAGYLLGNVALHTLATLILYAALARMTGARGRSAFVAGVFALHPLHVESVAWISERKDVLSGFFFMLALWTYAAYAERPRLARWLLVIACLLLGMLSKATVVTLPAVFLLLDCWPLGRLAPAGTGGRVSWRRALLEKLPMFALAALVSTFIFLAGRAAGGMASLEVVSLAARVRNALEAYGLYAAKSFWPSGLAVIYPLRVESAPVWPAVAGGLLLAAVTIFVVRQLRARPYLFVGWFWYLGMLVPTIGLVQVGSQSHADRFMYLPQIGLSIMVAWGACDLLERLRARRFAAPAAVAALAALGAVTWLQLQHWRDSIALFEHALAVTERNAVAQLQLGSAYLAAGNADAAERHYGEAAVIAPDPIPAQLGLADVRSLRGELPGAVAAYEAALRVRPDDPLASGRYGVALLRAGRVAEARAPLERAIAAHVGSPTQYAALADVYAQLGRTRDAIASYRTALALDPGQLRAANNLAWLLATSADASPEERQEAVELAQRAARLGDAEDPSLLDTVAAAYAAVGRFHDAEEAAALAAAFAQAQGHPQLADELLARGALYAAGRAYVEPSPPSAPDEAE